MAESTNVQVYDSTLRDGAQAEGIAYSLEDKLLIARRLDELGVDYIEGGWPNPTNPKDLAFFREVDRFGLKARITAFGSTRRPNHSPDEDKILNTLLNAETESIALFGKSWILHVEEVLRTTGDENRAMIEDSVAYLVGNGREVIYDAEHYFDGYKADPDYAIETLLAAERGGAAILVLCDTNGGTLPSELTAIIEDTKARINTDFGIHTHNDAGVAVANSILAVESGAVQIQGTFNGYGERCGNANLCTIIPALELKLGIDTIGGDRVSELMSFSRFLSEVANVAHDHRAPYVGESAFAHKGGAHVDGVMKVARSFEHMSPESVGNERRFLVSDQSGGGTIVSKLSRIVPGIDKKDPLIGKLLAEVKEKENQGYQYEAAEGSFELMARRVMGVYKDLFKLENFRTINRKSGDTSEEAEAIIKVDVDGRIYHEVAAGDGPVNALDTALRQGFGAGVPQHSPGPSRGLQGPRPLQLRRHRRPRSRVDRVVGRPGHLGYGGGVGEHHRGQLDRPGRKHALQTDERRCPGCRGAGAMKSLEDGSVTSPQGFKAAGIHCGIKEGDASDLALVYSLEAATAAAVYTTNQVQAAPIQIDREHLSDGSARAVVLNSGNANACTGDRGERDGRSMCAQTATALGLETADVLVCSTGVIGVEMPMEVIGSGIPRVAEALSDAGGGQAAAAIMTTDTYAKSCGVELELDGVPIRIGGMAKGAGMIAPNMATMLSLITTDAAVEHVLLQQLLLGAVHSSFNCITVDGDMSTNDTVIALANGVAGGAQLVDGGESVAAFAAGLERVCRELAKMIARDGEGATKLVAIKVSGARSKAEARRVGLSVANSNLVKTAVFGCDPNWGRILCAIGYAGVAINPGRVRVSLCHEAIYSNGAGVSFAIEPLVEAMRSCDIPIEIDLGAGTAEAEIFTCDFSYDYVRINAEYTT